MRLVYLASPYTTDSLIVRNKRRKASAATLAYYFYQAGDSTSIYSPITQWGYVEEYFDVPMEFDAWIEPSFFMIRHSASLWVLPLMGWQGSRGVQQEMEYASDIGRPISFVQLRTGNKPSLYLSEANANWDDIETYAPSEIITNVQIALRSNASKTTR